MSLLLSGGILVGGSPSSSGSGRDGDDGWSPSFAIVSDGERRVLQVEDWAGGEGAKPTTGQYVGPTGFTGTLADAVDVRGPGADDGWTPVFSIVTDGSRSVLRVVDWTGGQGTKPATGVYLSATGFTSTLSQAVDIRGSSGSYERSIFRAAATAPAIPTTPNAVTNPGDNPALPALWSATPPDSTLTIWASFQRIQRGRTAVTYTTPRPWGGRGSSDAALKAQIQALGVLLSANNLNDVGNAATALANLGGITSAAAQAIASARYTDAEKVKLAGLVQGVTAATAQAIAAARFTDAEKAKLAGLVQGVTAGQAQDIAGTLIATLSAFQYDSASNTLNLALRDADIPAGIARDTEVASAYAALIGATFTGAVKGIDPVADKDFATKSYVDGLVRGSSGHVDAYIAWSADTIFSAAEFQAGTGIENASSGIIPDQNGFAYLALWLEGNHWDGIRRIDIDHGPNGINDLEAAVDREIGGVAGKYRRYTPRLAGDVSGGGTLRWQ